jgi:hypothetical protein
MFVYCFTLNSKKLLDSTLKLGDFDLLVDQIHKEFGQNIPKYCHYDGGRGCTTLFCVDVNVNITAICAKYNLAIGTLENIDIDESTYNNSYQIVPNYDYKLGYNYYLKKE